MLNVHTVTLEFLDTLCQKLVVVNKGPKVPGFIKAKSASERQFRIFVSYTHAMLQTYRQRLLWLVGSIQGFFPDLASHHDLLGFQS